MTESIFENVLGSRTTMITDVLSVGCIIFVGIPILRVLYFLFESIFDWFRFKCFFSSSEALKGKVVWVVGASSGIGKSTALEFASHGCTVILSSRRSEVLEVIRVDKIDSMAIY